MSFEKLLLLSKKQSLSETESEEKIHRRSGLFCQCQLLLLLSVLDLISFLAEDLQTPAAKQ